MVFKGQSISTTFELREVALERTKKRLGIGCHIFYYVFIVFNGYSVLIPRKSVILTKNVHR